ncbi:hypothetical protein [Saprospira grandis]|uniref:hypothetical protein n=1 Tax=Saprospira grandis TaxID=1008 RepID=UPI0022DE7AB6|nr:hypothetical protein [Saprospira grandis]WBM76206.1 hypothetical protein OP864_08220 [Saprospira grandis]
MFNVYLMFVMDSNRPRAVVVVLALSNPQNRPIKQQPHFSEAPKMPPGPSRFLAQRCAAVAAGQTKQNER